MRLWRISNHADLSGLGGLKAGGRWHTRGRPVVYLSESPASALLEILVHLDDLDELPDSYQLLEVRAPDDLPRTDAGPDLPPGWRDDEVISRALGDSWLARSDAALMTVPSAIVPFVENVLLNPLHPDARGVEIVAVHRVPFDQRLFLKG